MHPGNGARVEDMRTEPCIAAGSATTLKALPPFSLSQALKASPFVRAGPK